MDSFFSSKKKIIALIVAILVMLVLVPIVAILANIVIDQLFFASKRTEIQIKSGALLAIIKTQGELEEYVNKNDTFPRAEDGGLQALDKTIDLSLIFQYAYCLSNSGKATHYHLGFHDTLQTSLPLGADFNSNRPDVLSSPNTKCEGEWTLENGTLGGFDGTQVFDVVCEEMRLCKRYDPSKTN